jgi:uncharacterized membrane protein SirB2
MQKTTTVCLYIKLDGLIMQGGQTEQKSTRIVCYFLGQKVSSYL